MRTYLSYYNSAKTIVPHSVVRELVNNIEDSEPMGALVGPKHINRAIRRALTLSGWSGRVLIHPVSRMTITAKKHEAGLCLQTGNVSRGYADLLKLQSIYSEKRIAYGFLILLMHDYAKSIGSNLATYERFSRELAVFSNAITIPLVVVGIE